MNGFKKSCRSLLIVALYMLNALLDEAGCREVDMTILTMWKLPVEIDVAKR